MPARPTINRPTGNRSVGNNLAANRSLSEFASHTTVGPRSVQRAADVAGVRSVAGRVPTSVASATPPRMPMGIDPLTAHGGPFAHFSPSTWMNPGTGANFNINNLSPPYMFEGGSGDLGQYGMRIYPNVSAGLGPFQTTLATGGAASSGIGLGPVSFSVDQDGNFGGALNAPLGSVGATTDGTLTGCIGPTIKLPGVNVTAQICADIFAQPDSFDATSSITSSQDSAQWNAYGSTLDSYATGAFIDQTPYFDSSPSSGPSDDSPGDGN